MQVQRVSRFSFSTNARSEDKRARLQESKTTSDFQLAFLAWPLAGRAFNQALKFGVKVAIPIEVTRLDCGGTNHGGNLLRLELSTGDSVRSRTVIIAWRALPPTAIPNLTDFEGAGVSYWATAVEATLCEGKA